MCLHKDIFYFFLGHQRVKTQVYKIALSLLFTIFGTIFMTFTIQGVLLWARNCAQSIAIQPIDLTSCCHSLTRIEMTLTLRFMRQIWMLPKLTLILLSIISTPSDEFHSSCPWRSGLIFLLDVTTRLIQIFWNLLKKHVKSFILQRIV